MSAVAVAGAAGQLLLQLQLVPAAVGVAVAVAGHSVEARMANRGVHSHCFGTLPGYYQRSAIGRNYHSGQ